jgi:hypothetical protein
MAEVIPLEAVCPDCGLTWAVWLDTHDRLTKERDEAQAKVEAILRDRAQIFDQLAEARKERDEYLNLVVQYYGCFYYKEYEDADARAKVIIERVGDAAKGGEER